MLCFSKPISDIFITLNFFTFYVITGPITYLVYDGQPYMYDVNDDKRYCHIPQTVHENDEVKVTYLLLSN
jgi:hypothetical protein